MVQKWDYYVADCYYKVTKEPNIPNNLMRRLANQAIDEAEGDWILVLDKEFSLSDGLTYMGNLGFELVGIQANNLKTGDINTWYQPDYSYIFKRPKIQVASSG